MQELDKRAMRTQLVAVAASERRAAHHAALVMACQPLPDRLQPRIAVNVSEGLTRGHLGDVGWRVIGVGVGEWNSEAARQRRAHRRLARPGDTHHHDHWARTELFSAHTSPLLRWQIAVPLQPAHTGAPDAADYI